MATQKCQKSRRVNIYILFKLNTLNVSKDLVFSKNTGILIMHIIKVYSKQTGLLASF